MAFLDRFQLIQQPFLLGLLISFIGTLPFGYINLVGLQILFEKGNLAVIQFVLGIVLIEFVVLKWVGIAAKWLLQQKRILLLIDLFMILFFLGIGLFFLKKIGQKTQMNPTEIPFTQYSFVLGLLLNSLNLMQWPYWSGVYVYLFRTEKLNPTHPNRQFIWGALSGTFAGILCFDYGMKYLITANNIEIKTYSDAIFAMLFIGLSLIQLGSFIWKRYNKNSIS